MEEEIDDSLAVATDFPKHPCQNHGEVAVLMLGAFASDPYLLDVSNGLMLNSPTNMS
ncbi:hypothetical protein ACJJI4_03565 [Microbulbifer sp. TRSA002]|uniref:hypothetical protein n=1 Tax=Microbulbifer sp. TRSA002 TaxID=3243382 RepID=UPI004039A061